MEHEEFGREYAREQIARQRSRFRRLIKSFYVSRVVRRVSGPTIDLGCGAGQILEHLPAGSVGIEVNRFLIEALQRRGLRVFPAAPSESGFNLKDIPPHVFKSLVLSHVLEHFSNADEILRNLLGECARLGISTVVVVVPEESGFRSDPTHKTFVDVEYLRTRGLDDCEGFRLAHHSYFPGNVRFIGRFFVYHELMIVYRATPHEAQ